MTGHDDPQRDTQPPALNQREPDGRFTSAAPGAGGTQKPVTLDELPVEARPPDIAILRDRLRRDYNARGWLILFDGLSTWTALHSGMEPIRACTPIELRSAIDAVIARSQPRRGDRP